MKNHKFLIFSEAFRTAHVQLAFFSLHSIENLSEKLHNIEQPLHSQQIQNKYKLLEY